MNENVFAFFVTGQAVPQGSKTALISKSTGRPIVVDKDVRLPRWRATVTEAAMKRRDASTTFEFPMTTPLAVTVTFVMDRPRSHYGSGKNADVIRKSAPRWPAKMPDIDKLLRAILDAITDAQIWRDDGQVVWVQCAKRYRDMTPLRGPGVHVSIAEAA